MRAKAVVFTKMFAISYRIVSKQYLIIDILQTVRSIDVSLLESTRSCHRSQSILILQVLVPLVSGIVTVPPTRSAYHI